MPACAVKLCRNYVGKLYNNTKITFHRFPTDSAVVNRWTDIIQQTRNEDHWKPHKTSVVCSEHFSDADLYFTKNGLRRLKKDSVPSKCLFLSAMKMESSINIKEAQDKGKPDKKESEVPLSHDFYDTVSDYKTESDDSDPEQAPQQYQVDVQGSWRAASPERRSASPASTAAGPSASHPASPAASHPSSPAASPPSSPAASPPASPTVGTPARRRKRARTSHHADTNEFYAFSQSIAAQLSSMPLKDAIQLQLEIQQLISKKRLSRLQQDMATQTQAADPLYLLVKAEPTEAMNDGCH